MIPKGRPGFCEWVDAGTDPGWKTLPLTHVTSGVKSDDILRGNKVEISPKEIFEGQPLAYFFYGRPAFRIGDEEVIKLEAACPHCFIFDGALLKDAEAIFAFDTGAFDKRLYSHVMQEEMNVADSLSKEMRAVSIS